jgi:hypothetical protein
MKFSIENWERSPNDVSKVGARNPHHARLGLSPWSARGSGLLRSRLCRLFSSAEYCLRVARRMSLMTCSAGAFPVPDFCLIFAPLKGYDEPEILRSQLSRLVPYVRGDS